MQYVDVGYVYWGRDCSLASENGSQTSANLEFLSTSSSTQWTKALSLVFTRLWVTALSPAHLPVPLETYSESTLSRWTQMAAYPAPHRVVLLRQATQATGTEHSTLTVLLLAVERPLDSV